MSVVGRCRRANPGWLLRSAFQDQRTGAAGRGREASVGTVTTVLTLTRAGYGLALLCAPQALIKLTGDPVTGQRAGAAQPRPSRRACGMARVLGVRHLVQAGLTAVALRAEPGSPLPLGLGAAVDVLHASTMMGLGLVDRGARRVALADTGVELALAMAGVVTATRY